MESIAGPDPSFSVNRGCMHLVPGRIGAYRGAHSEALSEGRPIRLWGLGAHYQDTSAVC